jgi:hypothetical protein
MVRVNGREVQIEVDKLAIELSEVKIATVGRETFISARVQREKILLDVSHGQSSILDSAFFQAIWFPPKKINKSKKKRSSEPEPDPIPISFPKPLNESQENAVKAILSPYEKVVLVRGPPGTDG